jgi:2-polyprenyl-3-methyl-5-hydroxy-6-metoxy-1,4-benzoquinol methylase
MRLVSIVSRLKFLKRVVRSRIAGQDKDCPYCGSKAATLIGRKNILLEFRRCESCGLMFRWPKDTFKVNEEFYQAEYREGMTTNLPNPTSLERWKHTLFSGTEKDLTSKVSIVKSLIPSGRLLDYGCSWGYGTFQFQAAGYEAIGFEISRCRAEFGRQHLGVKIVTEIELMSEYRGICDIVFASHVLEHLPNLSETLERISQLLRKGGLLVAFVPNGDGRSARELGQYWGPLCCEKHPLALDSDFFHRALPKYGFSVRTASDPYDINELKRGNERNSAHPELSGDELMVWAEMMSS